MERKRLSPDKDNTKTNKKKEGKKKGDERKRI